MGNTEAKIVHKSQVMKIDCELYHEKDELCLKIGERKHSALLKTRRYNCVELSANEGFSFMTEKAFLVQGVSSSLFVFFCKCKEDGSFEYPSGVTPLETGFGDIVVFTVKMPFTMVDKFEGIFGRQVLLSGRRLCYLSDTRKLENYVSFSDDLTPLPSDDEKLVAFVSSLGRRIIIMDREHHKMTPITVNFDVQSCYVERGEVFIIRTEESTPTNKRCRTE